MAASGSLNDVGGGPREGPGQAPAVLASLSRALPSCLASLSDGSKALKSLRPRTTCAMAAPESRYRTAVTVSRSREPSIYDSSGGRDRVTERPSLAQCWASGWLMQPSLVLYLFHVAVGNRGTGLRVRGTGRRCIVPPWGPQRPLTCGFAMGDTGFASYSRGWGNTGHTSQYRF